LSHVADCLRHLAQWRTEHLVEDTEFEEARERLARSISFPSRLTPAEATDSLALLRDLGGEGLLTAHECEKARAALLDALVPKQRTEGARQAARKDKQQGNGNFGPNDHPPEDTNDKKYFGYYGDFAHQELMLNDAVRTSAYQRAIFENRADFEGKVVIDVGAGTGVLAMFAAKAGARKVYAIEASNMAHTAEKLIAHNKLSHIITVVKGKVEIVDIPEQADVLVSEPLGFWLFNEQMIQSFVAARDRWLKPGGKMFPCHSVFFTAPCYVPEVRRATLQKSASWLTKQDFYGLDFSCAEEDCRKQHLERIVVDQVLPSQVVAPATQTMVDFTKISVEELNDMVYPMEWETPQNVLWDAVGMWFDTFFVGSTATVCLSTRPDERLTCWYQTLCILPEPRLERKFFGQVTLVANTERTYDITAYGGPLPEDRDALIHRYGFTLPVYRYYEHFQDLLWDITLFPEIRCGAPLLSPTPLAAVGDQPQQVQIPLPLAVPVFPPPRESLASAPSVPVTNGVPLLPPVGVCAPMTVQVAPEPAPTDNPENKRARKDTPSPPRDGTPPNR